MWMPVQDVMLVKGQGYEVKLALSDLPEEGLYAGSGCFYIGDELHFNVESILIGDLSN